MVHLILSKILMDTNTYVYVKQRKSMEDCQAVLFNIHNQYLGPDHVARQTEEAEAKRKLQISNDAGERKGWDWDKYVTLHKEHHTIM